MRIYQVINLFGKITDDLNVRYLDHNFDCTNDIDAKLVVEIIFFINICLKI